MNNYTSGVILKRKFENFGEVEVIGTNNEYSKLRDQNGVYFVLTNKLSEFFDIIEPETIVNRYNNEDVMDSDTAHNISAGHMNHPSYVQQHAFDNEKNK